MKFVSLGFKWGKTLCEKQMILSEAIKLLKKERDANQSMINKAAITKATAGGDAQDKLDYIIRRTQVVNAYDTVFRELENVRGNTSLSSETSSKVP